MFALLCVIALVTANCSEAFAAKVENAKPARTSTTALVTIKDPKTNQVWKWNVSVPKENIVTNSLKATNGQGLHTQEAKIDATNLIASTFPSQTQTLEDDINLTVGLTYDENVPNNTVSLKRVFGNYQASGLYYATNRKVWWANSGGFDHNAKKPTSNTWSYTPNTAPCSYSTDLPPYVLSECTVNVSGMTATRTISVQLDLNL